jgi:hypothetical protein
VAEGPLFFSSLLFRRRSCNYMLEENTDLDILKFIGESHCMSAFFKHLPLHSEFYKHNDISQGVVT